MMTKCCLAGHRPAATLSLAMPGRPRTAGPAVDKTLGTPSHARTGPEWSSSVEPSPTAPGLSPSATGLRLRRPTCMLVSLTCVSTARATACCVPRSSPMPSSAAYAAYACRSGAPAWGAVGMACPANSYYDFCGPPCPATCADLNSSTPCTRQCTAGCFCLEGFALEAGVCVPLAHCGCHLQGRYIPLGAEVLPTATCDQKCVCRGPGQPLECRPHACGRRERCRQRQGVWGCYPMRFGTMWLYGDPHLRTFNGTHRHVRGPGRELLVRTCQPHHAPFAIWVEIRRLKPWAATWAQQVDVDVAGWQLSLLAGQFGMVQVNGSQARLPLILAGGAIRAFSSSSAITVQAASGFSVAFHETRALWVTVPETYTRALCGLGGAFDVDLQEDLGGPNGTWLPNIPGAPMGPAPLWPQDQEAAMYQTSCGVLGAPGGPFGACHKNANIQVLVENCILDLHATGGAHDTLCAVLGSYTRECQRRGLPVWPWRHLVACELACPPHSHYELCGSSCPSSCAEPALPDSCPTPCQEGCQCDPGFMLSGTDCVPPTQCGCSLEGRYHLLGEIFWAGERCERLCYCEASTGMVRCSPYSCGPGQRCGVLRGVFGCHALSPGTCQAAGCLDINTQDGRPDEFSGTCTSGFATSEGTSGSLPFHKVELGKEENSSDYPAEIIPVTSFPVQGVHACLQREVSRPSTTGNSSTVVQAAARTCPSSPLPPSCPRSETLEYGGDTTSLVQRGRLVTQAESLL
ncbi:zonadhesin-like isoform X2 [Ochotona princeps]|uniref:zonadhesin-like isoform X2 n=1 Tax=Ochotona princeps TaxID=9978 RepID=UPI002714F2F5|nr:zonadhesin-like isoform X2 [Ochotona princeps]